MTSRRAGRACAGPGGARARAREPGQNARCHGARPDHGRDGRGTAWRRSASPTRARPLGREARAGFGRFWRGRPQSGSGLGSRSSRPRPSGTVAARTPTVSRSRSSCPPSQPSEKSQSRGYNGHRSLEKGSSELPAPTSTRSLVLVIAAACVSSSAGRRSPSPRAAEDDPAPKPLDQAVSDALSAAHPARHHRPRHVHEQPVPVRRARRPGRVRAHVGRLRAALAHERRPRPDRAAVGRRRRSDRLEPAAFPSTTRRRTRSTAPTFPTTPSAPTSDNGAPPHARRDRPVLASSASTGRSRTRSQRTCRPAGVQRLGLPEARRRAARLARARLGRRAREPLRIGISARELVAGPRARRHGHLLRAVPRGCRRRAAGGREGRRPRHGDEARRLEPAGRDRPAGRSGGRPFTVVAPEPRWAAAPRRAPDRRRHRRRALRPGARRDRPRRAHADASRRALALGPPDRLARRR